MTYYGIILFVPKLPSFCYCVIFTLKCFYKPQLNVCSTWIRGLPTTILTCSTVSERRRKHKQWQTRKSRYNRCCMSAVLQSFKEVPLGSVNITRHPFISLLYTLNIPICKVLANASIHMDRLHWMVLRGLNHTHRASLL